MDRDTKEFIYRYESGKLRGVTEMLVGFQRLIDTGEVSRIAGKYLLIAKELVIAGHCEGVFINDPA